MSEAVVPAESEGGVHERATEHSASPRLGWLDALRGIAAMAVVFQHVAPSLLWQPFELEHRWVDTGMLGVFLFFLISGYIVPASLERRGDLRAFWVGRVFRLHPPFLVVVALAALLPAAYAAVDTRVYQQWWSAVGGALMLPDLLRVPGALRVAWTLSYEMVFYFLISALFACGRERACGPVAVGLTAVGVFAGSALPLGLLSAWAGPGHWLVVASALTVVLALTCIVIGARGRARVGAESGGRVATRTGALLLGTLASALVFLNGRTAGFETMAILATMFAGNAIYRAEQGQISRTQGVLCCALVFVGCLVAGERQGGRYLGLLWTASAESWCAGFAAAWLLFLLGWLLRARSVPRALSWLGAVSYAVYLIHVPLLSGFLWLFAELRIKPHGLPRELLWSGAFLAALFAASQLVHRLVELPAQRLGRRLSRR